MPFFFLLVDSWLISAVAARGGSVLAGCVLSKPLNRAGLRASDAAGAESTTGYSPREYREKRRGAVAREYALPRSSLFPPSQCFQLPMRPHRQPRLGLRPKGKGLVAGFARQASGRRARCADAAETSGFHLIISMDRAMHARVFGWTPASFCMRAMAAGSAGGTGTPNLMSLSFASPTRGGERVILHNSAVIPRGNIIVLGFFVNLSEHPVGLIGLAVQRDIGSSVPAAARLPPYMRHA